MSVKTKSYLEGEKKEKKSMPKQEIKEKNENEPPPPRQFLYLLASAEKHVYYMEVLKF